MTNPQAASFRARAGDRAAPINAARRPLTVRQYIADEPHRPRYADIEGMLRILPYGMWACDDGRIVLFNRNYSPIWERLPNGTVQRANAGEWVKWTTQRWFDFTDARYERRARDRLRKILQEFFDGKDLTAHTINQEFDLSDGPQRRRGGAR